MGTITRNFANNLTTSGLLKPTAFNNDSFDNVTAVPSGSVETGAMVLISSQTANNSASISFTTGIDSTYKEYQFCLVNMGARTSTAILGFNGSTDGGSNYNIAKTSTFFKAYHRENASGGDILYRTAHDLAQGTGNQNITEDQSTDADDNICSILTIYNPSSTTYVKHFIGHTSEVNFAENQNQFYAGYFNTTSAINAIRFSMTSGNFDGTILMYGIK